MKQLDKLNTLHELAKDRADKIDSMLDSIQDFKHERENAPSASDLIFYIGLEMQAQMNEFYEIQTAGQQAIEELKKQPNNQPKKEAK